MGIDRNKLWEWENVSTLMAEKTKYNIHYTDIR